MSYSPLALITPQYDEHPLWWLKAYSEGTTTPLAMATDATGGTTAAKFQLDLDGFPVTAGNARIIPFVDGQYDLWLFPTAIEADANDTTNAIQFADNLNTDPFSKRDVVADSLASLIAMAIPKGDANVYVIGRTSAGDGYEGMFVWLSTVQSANVALDPRKGVFVAPASDVSGASGAWKRQRTGGAYLQWFDALGDGTTDDSPALQAAINFTNGTGGRSVINQFDDLTLKTQITCKSNITIRNEGRINIATDMAAPGAFNADTIDRFKFIGGDVEITSATYTTNIFLFDTCTNCQVKDVDIIDAGVDRYPLGPIRSLYCINNRYENIDISDCISVGVQSFEDDRCKFKFISIAGAGTKTLLETNNGTNNMYFGNDVSCPSNTATSAFGFNDETSIAIGNHTVGGAHGITVGHAAPDEAHNSVVMGNVADAAGTTGINIQATKNAVIAGNAIKDCPTGIQGTTGAESNVVGLNTVLNASVTGFRAGDNFTLVGNVAEECGVSYRPHTNDGAVVVTGNISLNCTDTGFYWGVVAAMKNGVLVGNYSGDNQLTPTTVTHFASSNVGNLLIGNASDGNATFREFDGPYSSAPNKDLSVATAEMTPNTKAITGGAGSAGSGNQYIALVTDDLGTTYKILHDGTV